MLLANLTVNIEAQITADTLTTRIRQYVNRNFSESRTFNLYWEVSPSHDYTLKRGGEQLEKGTMHSINTVKFSVTVPVLRLRNFSFYVNTLSNFYQFEATNKNGRNSSSVLFSNENSYEYYKGSFNGTYHTKIGNKYFLISATLSGDGWNKGFKKMEGSCFALMTLKQTRTTNFSVGLYGTTLFNQIPVIPIVTYYHQFNPGLSIDVTLPSRFYLRYQFLNNHRLSIGTAMESEQFYIKPEMEDLPRVCYYSEIQIKPELVYEFIINKHFYLTARGGGMKIIKGGLYNINRKGIGKDPYVKMSHPLIPFFNVGIAYNLFKDR